jgi:catechol 2,3-dioxygenase
MTNATAIPGTESWVTRPPGYRLPSATHVGRVQLDVAELERSLRYYQQVLGFRLLERTTGHATLGASGSDDVIVELHEVPGATPTPNKGRLGLYHFAILLPTRADLGRFVAHLGRMGVRAGQGDHLVSEAFYLNDPDGLGIEVYADRPRDSWPVRDNQLQMATDPVDVASLVHEGGDTPWSGMPAGAVIGHVHLHVGDIGAAETFFHRAVGFDKVFRMPSALFMSAGGYHHHLGTNTWAPTNSGAKPGDARLREWTLHVPTVADADAAAASIAAAGHVATRTDDGWLIDDPWGTRFRIAVKK